MFITLIWGIIFAIILVNAVLVGLAAVGLIWMPFGAFIYAREGKKKGQSPIRTRHQERSALSCFTFRGFTSKNGLRISPCRRRTSSGPMLSSI